MSVLCACVIDTVIDDDSDGMDPFDAIAAMAARAEHIENLVTLEAHFMD